MLMPAYNTAQTAVAGATPSTVVTSSESSSIHHKDTTWTKLFVGGLPYHTTDATLRDHFKVYGEIDEAVVITDRQTGKSRGYGFVIMADRASAERACKEPNPIIDGRKANVNLAILGAKPRGNAAVAASFPFTAVRAAAGYPASLLANSYGLQPVFQPAAAAYQPTMLSTNSLANALATQFYDYQPVGIGTQFAQAPASHFAQNSYNDPYANYIAAAQAQAAQAQAQQQAVAAAAAANSPYAYLQGAGGNTAVSNGVLANYAHQTESRIQ